ncbi:hypothetical protein [Devosia sp.]|uniref:hypothetical protein n=1 Tax=Devosia sp. TaxID=1871048 RepID=UPI003A8FEFE9
MSEQISDTVVQFRVKRATEFIRQWRGNAERLLAMAETEMPALVRNDALNEAQTAMSIVARRGAELEALTKQRGYGDWPADPVVSPIIKDLRALVDALEKAAVHLQSGGTES